MNKTEKLGLMFVLVCIRKAAMLDIAPFDDATEKVVFVVAWLLGIALFYFGGDKKDD